MRNFLALRMGLNFVAKVMLNAANDEPTCCHDFGGYPIEHNTLTAFRLP